MGGFTSAFLLLLFFILVNLSLSKLFNAARGIWQEDPLSPFLFTIMVEGLSLLLMKARRSGVIEGFEMGWNGEAITHLQFASDTIIFNSLRREAIVALRRIL